MKLSEYDERIAYWKEQHGKYLNGMAGIRAKIEMERWQSNRMKEVERQKFPTIMDRLIEKVRDWVINKLGLNETTYRP